MAVFVMCWSVVVDRLSCIIVAAISCPVLSVAPLDLSDTSFAKLFSDPHDMSKKCLLCRFWVRTFLTQKHLEFKIDERLKATLCIDGVCCIGGQLFLVVAVLELGQNDNRRMNIF